MPRTITLEADHEHNCVVAVYEGRTFADETPSAVLRQVADYISDHDEWR